LNATTLSNLLTDSKGLAELLLLVLNPVLQAQASEQLNAERYERSEDRAAYRNGHRPRTLYTRIGLLTLPVPQFRVGVSIPIYSSVISATLDGCGIGGNTRVMADAKIL